MNRILIVEDDKDISRELKELLENSGYEAVVLTDFKMHVTVLLLQSLTWYCLISIFRI